MNFTRKSFLISNLRAPSIGLVPPLQKPGSKIQNFACRDLQLPAVSFLAFHSYRNLKIQNPCVTHFKSSKMDLTCTNQSLERCQRHLSTQNSIENVLALKWLQHYTNIHCVLPARLALRAPTASSSPAQEDRAFSHSCFSLSRGLT